MMLVLAATHLSISGMFFWKSELGFRDFLVRHGKRAPADPRLMFLAIDSASESFNKTDLESIYADIPRDSKDYRGLELIARHYPWPREVYALILDKLFEAGAKVVAFDLLFAVESANEADDKLFRAALDRHRDGVVIGSNIENQTLHSGQDIVFWTHSTPSDTLIPETDPPDDRVAYVNFFPNDADSRIREARLHATIEGLDGKRAEPDSKVLTSLAARAVAKAGMPDHVPAGNDVDRLFRYTAPGGVGYPAVSLFQIFVPRFWNTYFGGGEKIRGKIIIIGAYGAKHHDQVLTPYGTMEGPELHLNVMNALIHRAFLSETPHSIDLLLILGAAVVAWLLSLMSARPALQIFRLAAVTGIGLLVALVAYNYLGLFIGMVAPLLALNLSGGACFVYQFVIERLEKARTRRALERYVSKDVVRELLDNPEGVLGVLGGARKPITILFSDLRNFTTIVESANEVELVTQLNEYFNEMVRAVFATKGTLDKFIGDAVMAHWGSIVSGGTTGDACSAVRTALDMRKALAQLNAAWQKRGLMQLAFGVGINSGEAVVGNLGCEAKMEVTVIGDPVNAASRIEGATKLFHIDLLIGEATARLVRDFFVLRSVDELQVKGKKASFEVFTVLSERDAGTVIPEWLTHHETGIQLYRRREFAGASAAFAQAAALQPDDWLIQEYLRRTADFIANPPPADWDGVYVLTKK